MGSRMRRWRSATGIASTILGVFFLAFFMLLAVALTTYQQIAATRQVVTTTATAALRSAVPGSFVSESVATAQSQQATNLLVSATAYDLAIGHILPEYWPGARVQACLARPQGSPAPCTPGSSYLVTLPPATADALHIAGPMVVTNVQLVTTAPYKVTHFGQTTTWPEPVVAADVAVPLRISIGSLINIRPWATVAITNVLYADQGGQTGGNSRYIAYGTAPSQGGGNGGGGSGGGGGGGGTNTSISCDSWNVPSYLAGGSPPNTPCTTRPSWCPVNATSCRLSVFSAPNGGYWSGNLNYPAFGNLQVLYMTSGSFFPHTAKLPASYGPRWSTYVAAHASPRPTGNYCWQTGNGAGVKWASDLSPNYPYSPMPQVCVSPPATNIPSWVTSIATPGTSTPGSTPSWLCFGNPSLYGSGTPAYWVCGNPPA